MLTRLEIDGFKNLLGVKVDLGPFTCIAGPNGAGKSNLFDAVQLLSLLAGGAPIMEAAQRVRAVEGHGGDPKELFWTDGRSRSARMRLACEMIVPRRVVDDFGRVTQPSITFLRYELELGYEPPSGLANLGRLILLQEDLRHINLGDAPDRLRFPHVAKRFRSRVVAGRRSGTAFISTRETGDGEVVIQVHADGGSRGQPRPSPAKSAPRTIVGTTTTSSDPTILAARREMQSWRLLALEPSAMRSPDPYSAPPHVASNGAHLAAALYRLAMQAEAGADPEPERVYARVAGQLARLVGVRSLAVDRDDRRQLLTIEVEEMSGARVPTRGLSDGTLRFLALSLIHEDPSVTGLLCMEEPENGIHPARMGEMADLVRGLAVDAMEEPGPDNPMRQVIVNTHSPLFIQLQLRRSDPGSLLFAESAVVRGPGGDPVRTLRLRPLRGTWRTNGDERGIGEATMLDYLTLPPETQIPLEELA